MSIGRFVDQEAKCTNPFQARGETSTTTATESGGLDLVDDPIVALENNFLGLVPVAHLLRAGKVGRVASVKILENTVLILQAAVSALRCTILDSGKAAHGGP